MVVYEGLPYQAEVHFVNMFPDTVLTIKSTQVQNEFRVRFGRGRVLQLGRAFRTSLGYMIIKFTQSYTNNWGKEE